MISIFFLLSKFYLFIYDVKKRGIKEEEAFSGSSSSFEVHLKRGQVRERGPFLYDGVTRSPIWPSFFPPLGRKKKLLAASVSLSSFFLIYICVHTSWLP